MNFSFRFSNSENEVLYEDKEIIKSYIGEVPGEDEKLPESFHEHLMKMEGMSINSDTHRKLAQILFESLGIPEMEINGSELIEAVANVTDKRGQDITFIFGLMALSLEGHTDKAGAYFSACIPDHFQLETLPGFLELQEALNDASNPGGVLWGPSRIAAISQSK